MKIRSHYTNNNGDHVFISDIAFAMMSGHILSVDHCPLCQGEYGTTQELLNYPSQEAHDANSNHNPIRFGPMSPKCVYCAVGASLA